MTLVVGIIAKDGVVIASDSRMTSEITSNDNVDKILKLGEHSAVGISGDGTLGLHMLKVISEDFNYDAHGIVKLVEKFREKGKEKFEDYFSHQQDPSRRPTLTFLIAGYEKNTNQAEIYELSSKDNFVPRPAPIGHACIGIPYIADYLLNRFYEKQITVKQAEVLAAFCIMETETQSHDVGGDIKIASISSDKSFSTLSLREIEAIKEKNKIFHTGNKSKFYPEEEPPTQLEHITLRRKTIL